MKTTLEVPDSVYRQVKARAALKGQTVKAFVLGAIQDKLRTEADQRKQTTKLQALLRKLESESIVLCPDRETADWYASIRHDLKTRGRPMPENDLWIAALSRQHALEVVSQDPHFDHVDKVRRVG